MVEIDGIYFHCYDVDSTPFIFSNSPCMHFNKFISFRVLKAGVEGWGPMLGSMTGVP